MITAKQLTCEYFENPIGIDVRRPRLSWQLESDERDVMQKAFRLQVAEDPRFQKMLLDTGRVFSDCSIHIAVEDLEVFSLKRYYWRVKVWDREGRQTDWSETAYWEMGLLDSEEWRAKWIVSGEQTFAEKPPYFRRIFRTAKPIQEARIYATSRGLYELHLNGERVGDRYFTPGWTNYNKRLQYQTYDVTSLLKTGENIVGAIVGKGWFSGNLGWQGRKNIYGSRSGLLLELHIVYADGEREVIATDQRWQVGTGPILTSEIYHGEAYDARLEREWTTLENDGGKWTPAETADFSRSVLVAQESQPVRKINEIKPVKMMITPKGETVLDIGQNITGWIRFSIDGEKGREVVLRHAEVLDKDGNFYTGNLRSARQTIRYVQKGEKNETFEPHFTFHGFRYVQLIGFPPPVDPSRFTAVVLHSNIQPTGRFECGYPLINQLQHNIVWGQKGNFLDVPTDCPQRDERFGWTGDAQVFVSTASFLTNVAPFFKKWLRDLKSEQLENGGVPHVIPHVMDAHEHSSTAWGDAAVICPWVIYKNYGDRRILEEQYDSMIAWVEYMRHQGDNEYLWNTGTHYGDWLGLDARPDSYKGATDEDLIATAFYAYSTSVLVKAAKALDRQYDAVIYQHLYHQIVEAFQNEFVTRNGRLAVQTQTAHVLALAFNLVHGPAKERMMKRLADLIEDADFHLQTGFVGTPYLNFVLTRIGRADLAFRLLFQESYPSWLYQVKKGATTIWEHWDGIKEDGSFWSEDMNSFNHYAYGSIGDWLYRSVLGIDTDEEKPGFKHIRISPLPVRSMSWAKGELESVHGLIRSQWIYLDHDQVEIQVTIPANTTATIFLPHADEENVTESGKPVAQMAGLHSRRKDRDGMHLEVGSGTYTFRYTYLDEKEKRPLAGAAD
ncbi:alpha-L-rhamnosidase [Sporolactobacillus sp. THM7-7]|nr:alpha-L-rhamnosidase [Sporolactobacillus sp. THM7-7]